MFAVFPHVKDLCINTPYEEGAVLSELPPGVLQCKIARWQKTTQHMVNHTNTSCKDVVLDI